MITAVSQTKLASLRRYHNFSQPYMADLIDVDVRTYINKENGTSQFKLTEMFIISRKFDMPIDEIFLPPNFM
ncbi:XRE family transcriptional regulator [Oceanobacillus sp. ISL-73]|uniref:helix-turn-helix transcriptional regulator n=1 Tax=Oceanobacillus sp. ISL-73 TaxID=2819161 RepID=UPI003336234A